MCIIVRITGRNANNLHALRYQPVLGQVHFDKLPSALDEKFFKLRQRPLRRVQARQHLVGQSFHCYVPIGEHADNTKSAYGFPPEKVG